MRLVPSLSAISHRIIHSRLYTFVNIIRNSIIFMFTSFKNGFFRQKHRIYLFVTLSKKTPKDIAKKSPANYESQTSLVDIYIIVPHFHHHFVIAFLSIMSQSWV